MTLSYRMDTKQEFWSDRWLNGQIGWHRSDFNKHLGQIQNIIAFLHAYKLYDIIQLKSSQKL